MARHQFAVFALAAISIASSFWYLLDIVAVLSKATESFGVTAFEKRFEVLHKSLPPHSVLGYVSDNPVNDEVTSQGEFYLTQYSLAPALIKADTVEPFEVANFHTAKTDEAALKARQLVAYRDYGNDVYLYRYAPK